MRKRGAAYRPSGGGRSCVKAPGRREKHPANIIHRGINSNGVKFLFKNGTRRFGWAGVHRYGEERRGRGDGAVETFLRPQDNDFSTRPFTNLSTFVGPKRRGPKNGPDRNT
jgi:hypothetical protein